MALRGVQPTTVEKRLKALFFGAPGVGKTTAAIQFPRPYLIDTERGAENDQYVAALKKSGGAYYFTADADDMITEVRALLSEKHDYRTLIIDPLSVPYNDLLDRSAAALATDADPTGTAFGRHKGPADRKIKHLLNLLLRLDMNVIITSHAKTKWEKRGTDVIDAGQTFDCYGKLDYLFDLVFSIEKRGTERVGIVRKSRIAAFPESDVFPFSYNEIATRYGREILERGAAPEVLASADAIAELELLLADRVNAVELREKWLEKARAESFAEMPASAVDACITFLRGGTIKTRKVA